MARRPERVLLIVNLHKDPAAELMNEIADTLADRGFSVAVFAFEGKPNSSMPEGEFGIAFSLGGDGTVLYAARDLAGRGIPIFPINLGTLGFIAAVQRDEWATVFDAWLSGSIPTSPRLMLDVGVERGGRTVARHRCLNDAVVAGAGISKIIRLAVEVGDLKIGRYRADGLIVATPTGSTAYSAAAGGPIVDPEMDAMILNPVCPFTLSNRPFVFPSRSTARIVVEPEQRSDVLLTVDGQISVPLEPGDAIVCRESAEKAILIAADRAHFYRVLRTKLNWSGGPDA
jgi:NAD+ kinase